MRLTVIAGCAHNADLSYRLARATADLPGADLTILAGTADSLTLNGLRRCPDLDACCTAAAAAHGHHRPDSDSTAVHTELAKFGLAATWLPATDTDFARDILRTHLLHLGYPLTHVTAALQDRLQLPTQVLPVTDDAVELHAVIEDPEHQGGSQAVHLERWQRMTPHPPVLRFVTVGIDRAAPTQEALEAIAAADVIVWLPASPVAVLAPIVHLPGLTAAVLAAHAPVIGVSPFVPGFPGAEAAAHQLTAAGFEATDVSCWQPLAEVLTHWVSNDCQAAKVPSSITAVGLDACEPAPLSLPSDTGCHSPGIDSGHSTWAAPVAQTIFAIAAHATGSSLGQVADVSAGTKHAGA